MQKKFNVTGSCIPERHYMVPLSSRLAQLFRYVEDGEYLTISRPRQYGKTTTLKELTKYLRNQPGYLPLQISFEGMAREVFHSQEAFAVSFVERAEKQLARERKLMGFEEELHLPPAREVRNLDRLDEWIENLVERSGRRVVLMIDEVDQNSGEDLFFSFLGLLRHKYLNRYDNGEPTFHSVILVGVRDIKNLKASIRSRDETTMNSPWNIALDYTDTMSFSVGDIASMLREYKNDTAADIDIPTIAEHLHQWTSGHPFLVSRLCKILAEELHGWSLTLLQQAVRQVLKENNTNFDSLIKNLENDAELYRLVYNILLMGDEHEYNNDHPVTQRGVLYGIFRNADGILAIHNRIYAERIYAYLSSKIKSDLPSIPNSASAHELFLPNGQLDFEAVLRKFQSFMKEQYSEQDKAFLERNGRLIFLAFLQPILNGKGFSFKEVQISEEKRLDVVVTYLDKTYIAELKRWYGPSRHQQGLLQLNDYLERQNQDKGYLVVFDFTSQTKTWKQETLEINGREVFAVWV